MPRTPFKHEDAEVIVVNTNEDGAPKAKDGKLTLREAIELSQQKPGSYYINFHNPNGKHGTHSLNGLGYWTIELQEPLPAIEQGNIIINAPIGNLITTKNVTLVPAFDGDNKITRSLKGETQMSMMTVGDVDYFMLKGERKVVLDGVINEDIGNTIQSQSYSEKSWASTWPRVEIYHFNFIKHKAQGGDGASSGGDGGGAGGGLGTGAGMSIVGGDVFLQNSVFQDLKVQGGSAERNGALSDGLGGATPNGLIGGWMGGPNYQMTDVDTDVDTVASPHGYMGDKTNQSGGGAAEQAESHGFFGQGGSGGGSGGNGACYAKPIKGLFGIVWNEFDYISLPGGDGADGTNGGFGAGGGAGGFGGVPGVAQDFQHINYEILKKCRSDKAEQGAKGHHGLHGFGSSPIKKWANEAAPDGGAWATGGDYGGNGAALGAGISVLNYNSNLILDRVDFIRNQDLTDHKGVVGRDWSSMSWAVHDLFTAGSVYAKEVNLYDSPDSKPISFPTNKANGKIDRKTNIYNFGMVDQKTYNDAQKSPHYNPNLIANFIAKFRPRIGGINDIGGIFPFERTLKDKHLQPLAPHEPVRNAGGTLHFGNSFITNKEHVRIRPQKPLINVDNRNDVNVINMESPGLGVIKIQADSSAITEGLNTAFGMLLPDRSSEIEAEYAAKVDSIWTDALNTAGVGFLVDTYKAIDGPKLNQQLQNGALGKTKLYDRKFATQSGIGAAFALNVGNAVYSVYTGLRKTEENRDIQLQENAKSQAKLAKLINKDRTIKFNDISTNEARSIVPIHNFKIGEDVIIFPGLADKYKLKYELTTKSKGL